MVLRSILLQLLLQLYDSCSKRCNDLGIQFFLLNLLFFGLHEALIELIVLLSYQIHGRVSRLHDFVNGLPLAICFCRWQVPALVDEITIIFNFLSIFDFLLSLRLHSFEACDVSRGRRTLLIVRLFVLACHYLTIRSFHLLFQLSN